MIGSLVSFGSATCCKNWDQVGIWIGRLKMSWQQHLAKSECSKTLTSHTSYVFKQVGLLTEQITMNSVLWYMTKRD